jgi:mono/diheme cytochrome c family protein
MRFPVMALAGVLGVSLATWSTPDFRGPGVADQVQPLTPFQVGRVERSLETRLACLGCHVIDGRGGRVGPPLDGLAERADAAYVARMIRDPAATVPGTLMPRERMSDRDAARLTTYLLTRPPTTAPGVTAPEAPPSAPIGGAVDGTALYARHCAACHGEAGRGDGWNVAALPTRPTAHADPQLMALRTDDSLFDAIHAGGLVLDRSPRMPPFGEMLSAVQIQALVSHIRTLCDCAQPAWASPR